MPRVKRGVTANKKRKKLRSYTKGYHSGRNSKITRMQEAIVHAFSYQFAHRRKKKGDFRTLWNTQINAAARQNGMPYKTLIAGLTKNKIALNRKILAQIAKSYPKIFTKIAERAR